MLEEQHWIIVADTGLQQTLRIVRRRRIHNLEPRRVQKIHFRIRGVKWTAVHAASRRPSDDDGRRGVPKIMSLCHKVGQLIEAAGDEIDELHLRHGTQPR